MSAVDSYRAKVSAIFEGLVGEKATDLCEGLCDGTFANKVKEALLAEREMDEQTAYDIGFHLSDWHADAAFIVALHLFPERFTSEEIVAGTQQCLIHAPNHMAAAAALFGYPVQDVWGTFPDASNSADESA